VAFFIVPVALLCVAILPPLLVYWSYPEKGGLVMSKIPLKTMAYFHFSAPVTLDEFVSFFLKDFEMNVIPVFSDGFIVTTDEMFSDLKFRFSQAFPATKDGEPLQVCICKLKENNPYTFLPKGP